MSNAINTAQKNTLTEEEIKHEIEEYRTRRLTKTMEIALDYMDRPPFLRLVKPGDYGPIRLEHEYVSPEEVNYVLTGSEETEDGKFPHRVSWIRALSRKEGATYSEKEGKLVIPLHDQGEANSVHTALIPVLASALDMLYDQIAWPRSPSTDIPTYVLDDSTEVIEEGKYGSIVLNHALSGSPQSRSRHIVYKLAGKKAPHYRFPGNPGWNRYLKETHLASYDSKNKKWRMILREPSMSLVINRFLFPLLKESIMAHHSFSARRRTEHIIRKIRANLERNGVDVEKLDAEIDSVIAQ